MTTTPARRIADPPAARRRGGHRGHRPPDSAPDDADVPPSGPPWTEESIRAGLTTLLAGRATWPTYDEFIAAGARGLRDAAGRIHGVEWWATELGVTGGDRRRGGIRRWTNTTIRAALAEFLGDRTSWPTQREFRQAGRAGLYEVLRHYGGSHRWATELGVTLPQTAPPLSTPKWTDDRIGAELSSFLADSVEWPRYVDFMAAGRADLYRAAARNGGPEVWAQRMGVRYLKRRGGPPTYWTEARIRERIGALLSGRARWPTPPEFEAAGEKRLLAAMHRGGGIRRWREEFGVLRPAGRAGRRTPAAPRIWTDAAIGAAISPLVAALKRWPTKTEFRAAGLGPALSAVYAHGGRALWQERLGVAVATRVGPPDRTRWTEHSIESELRRVCQGRTDWPSLGEFREMSALPAYRAASRHGGIERWRRRLAL
jgi:hypothetical protein